MPVRFLGRKSNVRLMSSQAESFVAGAILRLGYAKCNCKLTVAYAHVFGGLLLWGYLSEAFVEGSRLVGMSIGLCVSIIIAHLIDRNNVKELTKEIEKEIKALPKEIQDTCRGCLERFTSCS
ncbi:MAG: hypothetical protein QME51_06475 [Planctomycetota bacterium]|nr:hypothetical protein [Planctomycetota bacterium]